MSRNVTPAELTPASGLPLAPLPPLAPPLPLDLLLGARPRTPAQPDAVTFSATCPGCGVRADWTERRVDTHTEIEIDCRICARRDRMRLGLAASA